MAKQVQIRILVITGLLAVLFAGIGYYAVVWRQSNQSPHITVKYGVATDVSAVLLQRPSGTYYVETPEHQGDHWLNIVNSLDAAVQAALKAKLGKTVHMFGIRDAADSDDFAILWLDGKNLQAEENALPYFSDISFRQIYAHTTPIAQQCLLKVLGQERIDVLTKNRYEFVTSEEDQNVFKCIDEGRK